MGAGDSRAVVFRMGEQHFGVAVQRVREIVNPLPITPLFRAPDSLLGVVNLRGSLMAVLDLAGFLGLGGSDAGEMASPDVKSGATEGPKAVLQSMLMVESHKNGHRVEAAFLVDQVLDVATIAAESIDTAPEVGAVERKYIQGVCLHDSRPLTLIDVEAVLGAEMFLRLRGEKAEALPLRSAPGTALG